MTVDRIAAFWDNHVRVWQDKEGTDSLVGADWGSAIEMKDLLTKYAAPCACEIGCGGGRVTEHACKVFDVVHALDVSPVMIEECRKRINKLNKHNVTFHLCGGVQINLPDESMDVVFSHDVFVHFNLNVVYLYLKEIARVLKPAGHCILSFYNIMNEKTFNSFKDVSNGYNNVGILFQEKVHQIYYITQEIMEQFCADLGLYKLYSIDTGHDIWVICKFA